jgi:hypothetical protein
LATSQVEIPSRSRRLGVELGSRVAQHILAARADDGSDGPMDYTPGTQPGQYRPDPLHPDQMAIGPDWNMVKGFVIKSGAQFPAPDPPAMTSQQYTDAFNQVKTLGADGVNNPATRTAEQTEIGIYWAYDGVADIGTPPRLYNQIARVIAEEQDNTQVENARLFALINVAMQDVGVALWTTKYEDNFWRPITAIREADPGTGPSGLGDGNPNTVGDADWTPLGSPASNGSGTNFTPAFPAYSSGHAGFGAAVFGAIRNFYGTDNIAFSFTSDELNGVTRDADGSVRPLATRSFTSLSQAARENADSRVYLGVHWQFDVDQGMLQGAQVADYVFKHFAMPTPTQRWFMASHHIAQAVQALQQAARNLTASALNATDQALATTRFHANADPAPKAAVSASGNVSSASASSRSTRTAARTPDGSPQITSSRLGGNFAFPTRGRRSAGFSALFGQN